jgi:hypothetical protein
MTEKNVADLLVNRVNMLKSISSNLTSIFFHGLLILIFNSFNIEKKFYHEKLLPTSIVGSLPKPVWLAPPENFGLLGIRRRRLT